VTNVNDLKYKNYKQQQIIKYSVIVLSFLTIVLESLALFGMISYLWGLIPFVLTYFIKYMILNKDNKKKDDQNQK